METFSVKAISLTGRSAVKLILFVVVLLMSASCASPAPAVRTSPIKPIPPASQFTLPAEGTLLPPGTRYNETLNLPAGSSGALFINKTVDPVKVVVGDTFADIPSGQIYLFILDPGEYEFYIYGLTDVPVSQVEQLEFEKVRYLYLVPFGSNAPIVD